MKQSILIIDDEQSLRASLSAILQQEGYFVTTAGNGEEALQLLSVIQYDLVFLDLTMPGLSGLEVLARIHSLNSELPVLVLTANTCLETAIETLRQGAAGYLLKPVDPEQIIERARGALMEQGYYFRRNKIIDEIQKLLVELDMYE